MTYFPSEPYYSSGMRDAFGRWNGFDIRYPPYADLEISKTNRGARALGTSLVENVKSHIFAWEGNAEA
jgi:hypothetical protein